MEEVENADSDGSPREDGNQNKRMKRYLQEKKTT